MKRITFFESFTENSFWNRIRKARIKRMVLNSEMFDEGYYLSHNPDVAAVRMNAVEHFLQYGGKEGRRPHPKFDTEYYLESNPDVKASGMNPLVHYLQYGKKEGRMPVNKFEVFRDLSDEEWLDILIRSITETSIDGIQFPRFPDETLQVNMVGVANEDALMDAFRFYKEIRVYLKQQKMPFTPAFRILDFGCGWGRHYRFFMKDVTPGNIIGIDSDPNFIELCKTLNPEGTFRLIMPHPPADFEAGSFDFIYSYSVFSHLNESIGLDWIAEFARLLKTNGLAILTSNSTSFMEYCESLRRHPENQTSLRDKLLARYAFVDIQQAYQRYHQGDFVYSPSGGGENRPGDIYGETVLSKKYVENKWTDHFDLIDFLDAPSLHTQTIIVLRKKLLSKRGSGEQQDSIDQLINTTISPKDEMYNYVRSRMPDESSTRQYYFDTGKELAYNLANFLSQESLIPKNLEILDFAAGYGRVTRWLIPLFKKVQVSDLEQDMIDFHRGEYGIEGFVIDNNILLLQPTSTRKYDVVFVFSLFTHLPDHTWQLWLQAISRMVRENGYLVFSTHSYELFAELNPEQFGDPNKWVDEFLFWETNETNGRLETSVYGCTIVKEEFVRRAVDSLNGFLLIRHFRKGEFDRYQDIYIIKKES